jgi:hypothetical protein
MPAMIPKVSSASCMTPDTKRLAPDTIWPAASSITAVVSVAPGRKTTSDATMARRPAPVTSCSAAKAASAETAKAATTGIRIWRGEGVPPMERSRPTRAPSTAAAATSRRAGWRIRHNPEARTA